MRAGAQRRSATFGSGVGVGAAGAALALEPFDPPLDPLPDPLHAANASAHHTPRVILMPPS
jgi:hypothetical protein